MIHACCSRVEAISLRDVSASRMMRAMITVVFGAQLAQLASTKQELWPELNELLDASVQECAVESTCGSEK